MPESGLGFGARRRLPQLAHGERHRPAPTPTPRLWAAGRATCPLRQVRPPVLSCFARRPTGDPSSSTIRSPTTPSGRASTRAAPTRSSAWRCAARTDEGLGPPLGPDSTAGRAGMARGSSSRSIRSADALALSDADRAVGASAMPPDAVDGARRPRHARVDSGAAVHRQCRSGASAPRRRPQQPSTSRWPPDFSRSAALALTGVRAAGRDGRRAGDHRPTRRRHLATTRRRSGWERDRLGLRGRARPHRPRSVRSGTRSSPSWSSHRPGRPRPSGSRSARGSRRSAGSPWRDGTAIRGTCTPEGIPPTHSLAAVDHSIEVPAPVSQRHLRPEASTERGDVGRLG